MSRQAATPAATLSAVMLKNIDNQTIDGEEKSKPGVIKLGLDLHARRVTECRQLDGSTPKPALEQTTDLGTARVRVLSWAAKIAPIARWYRSFPPSFIC